MLHLPGTITLMSTSYIYFFLNLKNSNIYIHILVVDISKFIIYIRKKKIQDFNNIIKV